MQMHMASKGNGKVGQLCEWGLEHRYKWVCPCFLFVFDEETETFNGIGIGGSIGIDSVMPVRSGLRLVGSWVRFRCEEVRYDRPSSSHWALYVLVSNKAK